MLLLTHSRRATRCDPAGRLVLLADQDRTRWDRRAIAEGSALVREALHAEPASRFAIEAAIAAEHAQAASWDATNWPRIVDWYDRLAARWPSPVVALNRAVAVSFADGPERGLAELDRLGSEPALAGYGYLPAARADLLRRLGRGHAAREAYAEALLLTENRAEQEFLAGRLAELTPPAGSETAGPDRPSP